MIRNTDLFLTTPPAGFDGEFCWDFLRPAWAGTTCQPMDVDAMVERHGAYLLFETKHPGATVPRGQAIALGRLAALPQFTIVHCAKHPADIEGFAVWGPRNARNYYPGDAATLVAFCRAWFLLQEDRHRGITL